MECQERGETPLAPPFTRLKVRGAWLRLLALPPPPLSLPAALVRLRWRTGPLALHALHALPIVVALPALPALLHSPYHGNSETIGSGDSGRSH